MTHPYLQFAPHPRVLAHRGLVTPDEASAGVAENTLAAVAAADAAGARYVELDCHLTTDGEVVIFHDQKLTRVTGDERRVRDVTLAELTAIMQDRGGLITLADLLVAFPELRFNVDVKVPEAAEPAGRIIAPHSDRVLLTSFDESARLRALAACRAADGSPATSPGRTVMISLVLALALRQSGRVRRILASLDALQIPVRMSGINVFTPRLLRAAHEAGVEVHIWTINDVAEMRRLVALGVDGIVTDRADVALRALG
ncbi:glycerophosphodiester phosphodiesterase family protein [Microbacterium sp. ZW T5_56]|uniref:glycerophosphodiester phosphodiesterase family protein n=1 Tax=Microbacterium sp. ZW T5_56 TaxID=3378081 RepID=UPI003854858E